MEFLCPTLVFASVFAITTADYECLCNYHVENPLYPTTDNQAAHLGSLYEFDCKPTYQLTAAIPHWQAIQFEHQVGYVALDEQSKIQTCPGAPSPDDLVIHSTPKKTSVFFTSSTSTVQTTSASTTTSATVQSDTSTQTQTTPTVAIALPTSTALSSTVASTPHTLAPSASSAASSTSSSTNIIATRTVKAMSTSAILPTTVNMLLATTSLPPVTFKVVTKYITPSSTWTTSSPTVSTTTVTTTRVLQCPPQVQRSRYLKEFGSHCYEFILGVYKEWPAAESDCNLRGGHLVSIGSQQEQDFVYHSLGELDFHGDNGVWTGLTDLQHEGHWTWSSGERVTFQNWAPGQPGIFGSVEDCALVDMKKGGKWGDYSCTDILFVHKRHGYVCEFNKI